MLCIQRDYSKSWLGENGKDVPQDVFHKQYITSFYFVTTTLSTCGFGDISATSHDRVESLVMTLLILVSMLFYSYTIQKIQDFLLDDGFNAGEYALFMQEMVENLIVKVGQILSNQHSDNKIKIEQIF
jgi:hypothetical protein